MRSQKHFVAEVKSVLHISCRVILGDIERLKIEKVEFNFRSLRDRKSERCKYVDYLVFYERAGMQTAELNVFGLVSNVDALFEHLFFCFFGFERLFFAFCRARYHISCLVYVAADDRSLILGHVFHAAQKCGKFTALAEIFNFYFVKIRNAAASIYRLQRLTDKTLDLLFHMSSVYKKRTSLQLGRSHAVPPKFVRKQQTSLRL